MGDGSRPNFGEHDGFLIKCRLSVRALGRPTRLNPTVSRLRLSFSIVYELIFIFRLACPVAAGVFFCFGKKRLLDKNANLFLLWKLR